MRDETQSFLAGAVLASILWWGFSLFLSFVACEDLRAEAVKAGAAHYVDGDDGQPEFRWGGRVER